MSKGAKKDRADAQQAMAAADTGEPHQILRAGARGGRQGRCLDQGRPDGGEGRGL